MVCAGENYINKLVRLALEQIVKPGKSWVLSGNVLLLDVPSHCLVLLGPII
jgi:hypothetical protein